MQYGTVVVVDDEPHIAELVELYCSRDGFDVVCVRTGHEAIDVVARDHPRLVVLDVGLPDIDGLEVCRQRCVPGYRSSARMNATHEETSRVMKALPSSATVASMASVIYCSSRVSLNRLSNSRLLN